MFHSLFFFSQAQSAPLRSYPMAGRSSLMQATCFPPPHRVGPHPAHKLIDLSNISHILRCVYERKHMWSETTLNKRESGRKIENIGGESLLATPTLLLIVHQWRKTPTLLLIVHQWRKIGMRYVVLLSDPGTFGAGGPSQGAAAKTRLESSIAEFQPYAVCACVFRETRYACFNIQRHVPARWQAQARVHNSRHSS